MIESLFREVFGFIRKFSSYFRLVLIILIIGIVSGLFIPQAWKTVFLTVMMQKIQAMGEVTVFSIFLNNLFVALILIIGGVMVFVPFLVIFLNGLMLGALSPMLISNLGGLGLIGGLLPHGVFELSAFLFAGMLGTMVAARLLLKKRLPDWGELWIRISQVFVLIIIPLLAVAAVMEVNVSPRVAAALAKPGSVKFFQAEKFFAKHGFRRLPKMSVNKQREFFGDHSPFIATSNRAVYASEGSVEPSFTYISYSISEDPFEDLPHDLKRFGGHFSLFFGTHNYHLFLWKKDSVALKSLLVDLTNAETGLRSCVPVSKAEKEKFTRSFNKRLKVKTQMQKLVFEKLKEIGVKKVNPPYKVLKRFVESSNISKSFVSSLAFYRDPDKKRLFLVATYFGYVESEVKDALKILKQANIADQMTVLTSHKNNVAICLFWDQKDGKVARQLIKALEKQGYKDYQNSYRGE